MRILAIGNCQLSQFEALLAASGGHKISRLMATELNEHNCAEEHIARFDLVIVQPMVNKWRDDLRAALGNHPLVVTAPTFLFPGFHPDQFSLNIPGRSPIESRLAYLAYVSGLSKEEAIELYNPSFLRWMKYYDTFRTAKAFLIRSLASVVPDPESCFERWFEQGVFCYTRNHPKLFVAEDILRYTLSTNGLNADSVLGARGLAQHVRDPLSAHGDLPVVAHPHASNRLDGPNPLFRVGAIVLPLHRYVRRRYRLWANVSDQLPAAREEELKLFEAALERRKKSSTKRSVRNPYSGIASKAFWSESVALPKRTDVTPYGKLTPILGPNTRIATAGSCFAQHVARRLEAYGLTHYVAELPPQDRELSAAREHGYGVFSCRYGNVYTPRQLLQLFERAFGERDSSHVAWKARAGGWIDPFRPNVGEPFPSQEAVKADRAVHLSAVRSMFENLDVFVFTLGLTECWMDLKEGTVFPLAPGVVTEEVDSGEIVARNFNYQECRADLDEFVRRIKDINPRCKLVLTVSPVPLIATHSDNDALTATTYSKAVLRAVAGDVADSYAAVQYFPAFEIVTGPHAGGEYFETDLRSVRPEAVDHVMRVFHETLVKQTEDISRPITSSQLEPTAVEIETYQREAEIVCDEELVLRALRE